ncbi:hypothetical protein GGX14DRAFT_426572 [Mycena pura]|uniref:RanBP2-type domain-containing protein n=1 Tax=Mycena pura TaxID=153505 RepID=A0AAD6YLB2_9AGAR|nr:hypothetical protein GGX14DRAFT_426572 [Mycena pura]
MPHSRRSSTLSGSYNEFENDAPPSPASTMKSPPDFDSVLLRFQNLSTSERVPLSPLGPPFAFVESHTHDKTAANFAPRPASLDLSPQSSSSSSSELSSVGSLHSETFDAFVRTQSRVVRLSNLPHAFLSSVLAQNGLAPAAMWLLEGDFGIWAVFQTHAEACAALSLSSSCFSVAPALESDLEPQVNLKRFDRSNATSPQLYMNNNAQPTQRALHVSSPPVLHGASGVSMVPEEYMLSSNPPNPRTNFRLGDWIRNLTCIGCGCPRSSTASGAAAAAAAPDSPRSLNFAPLPPRPQVSPRFTASANSIHPPVSLSPTAYGFPPQSSPLLSRGEHQAQPTATVPVPPTLAALNKAAMSGYPLLTPSGRSFASGGKVQNISSDPLSPCIMYWPDNEPFPEQGQIRPGNLVNILQPPILNTGNRGPISHQPGDWICQKCNYLNWRRRKVCQTCLPYAEGNGDSISAAVQAERITLLTTVLAHTRLSPGAAPTPPPPSHVHPQAIGIGRSHSTTPAQAHRPFVNFSPPPQGRGAVHRSQSHSALDGQFAHGFPIYQTSPHQQPHPQYHRQHLQGLLQRPSQSARTSPVDVHAPTPAPLLPSFLNDMVQSPTLSPSSSSSADLSFEEYEDSLPSSTRSTFSQMGADSVHASPLTSIWRLDGEESKSLGAPAFPLPTRRERGLMGVDSAASSRNSSVEQLRVQISS